MGPDETAGFDAFKAGRPESAVPSFWLPSRRKAWLLGWRAARDNAKLIKLRPIWTEEELRSSRRPTDPP